MTIHRYITIFDISIQPKCVSIQYQCLIYHDMTIYQYIVASLVDFVSESLCKSFEGVQVIETISLQCNSLSQIHSSIYCRMKLV